jgi:hypothetical protein
VNADTTTVDGIEHATHLGLVKSGLVDVAVTSFVAEADQLFDDANHKGKCFAVMRHPVTRTISMFYYLQISTWERNYNPKYEAMSISEYLDEDKGDNWMVRKLTHSQGGTPLTDVHLKQAKDVLRTKCLVGFMEDFEESIRRFDAYFSWSNSSGFPREDVNACVYYNTHKGVNVNKYSHPKHEEGSEILNRIVEREKWDLQLFLYARDELYPEQLAYLPTNTEESESF